MLRSKPKSNYCGLTVILSNPSRFDDNDLLKANAGTFFSEVCLRPDFNRYQCDVRLKEDTSPFLDNTKCILLLGESATKQYLGDKNTLNEIRGSPYIVNGIPAIASYFPQDCVDVIDHESKHNLYHTESADFSSESDSDSDYDDEHSSAVDEKKRHGRTKRRNFGFWLKQDVAKCKYILQNGSIPSYSEPNIHIYPKSEDVIELLLSHKDELLFFDCETDWCLNITCFSFAFSESDVYVVPCLLPDYSWAYSSIPQILRALSSCIYHNTIVAHNGVNFDFFVLAHKLKIAVKRAYDTMLAHHRCYPEQEKSLGHTISLYTWLKFHKDLGDVPYNNLTNAQQTWQYCGLDVYSMIKVYQGIEKLAASRPGLRESIDQANAFIRPILTTTLQGIRYDDKLVASMINENDRLMTHYLHWLHLLIGDSAMKIIAGKGKEDCMPTSNVQCVRYFHDMLGYPIVGKGNERKDGSRGPSLGKKNLFKLRLKHSNPVIDICLAYRELKKETGSLKFTPWKQ